MKKTSGWPSFWLQGQEPPLWARLLEAFYCGLMAVRRWCYVQGLFKTTRLPVPVLVVGNRVVGGTGKTPLLMALIPLLQAQGWRVGVVSRGYGRKDNSIRFVTTDSNTAQVGDEPLLLFQQLNVPIVVGSNRVAAAQLLLAQQPVDVIVSDDGWQHWALGRDLVIEVVDGERGYGNGHCLPAGPLRERQECLPNADLTLYNGRDFKLLPLQWRNIKTGDCLPLAAVTGRVRALAGIGNPKRFFDSLERLDLVLENAIALADHQAIQFADFTWDDAQFPVIMTAKDAVRCASFAQSHWWALDVTTEINKEQLQPIINRLHNLAQQEDHHG
jgi:tetraacyldisaccharide 4'-kinase